MGAIVVAAIGLGVWGGIALWKGAFTPMSPVDSRTAATSDLDALAAVRSDCHDAKPEAFRKQMTYLTAMRGVRYATETKVSTYDILGIRLYMSARTAVNIAENGNGLSLDQLSRMPCVSDRIAQERQDPKSALTLLFPHTSCLSQVSFSKPHLKLTLNFVEDAPFQLGCMIVSSVGVNEDLGNEAGEQAWDRALTIKYGPRVPDQSSWGDQYAGPSLVELPGFAASYTGFELVLNDDLFEKSKGEAAEQAVDDARGPEIKPEL